MSNKEVPMSTDLPDLMPAKSAHKRWFPHMGKSAYYGALGADIPAQKFGGKWFVLTRPLLRILDKEWIATTEASAKKAARIEKAKQAA